MNSEQNEILQEFCNNLEDNDIICQQCADALRTSIYLSLIDTSNPDRNESIKLHIRCTSRLLRFFRDFMADVGKIF